MAFEIFWKLQTTSPLDRRRGDWTAADRPWAPDVDADSRRRQIGHYDYLTQVARAAELTGFDGIVIPDDPAGEEPWIVTGSLIRETRRLKLVTVVAPGSASAVYHAKMAASVQRFSGGRQSWALDLSDEGSVARAEELLVLSRGIWGDGPFDYDGDFFMVEKGGLGGLVRAVPPPDIWVSGEYDAAFALSLRHGDVHILAPRDPEEIVRRTSAARAAAGEGTLRIAADIPILARPEARDAAIEQARRALPANAVIGSFDAVADRLAQFIDAGAQTLILSGSDQIQDVHIAGEQIIARLQRRFAGADLAAA